MDGIKKNGTHFSERSDADLIASATLARVDEDAKKSILMPHTEATLAHRLGLAIRPPNGIAAQRLSPASV
jgi:hypothetical protein